MDKYCQSLLFGSKKTAIPANMLVTSLYYVINSVKGNILQFAGIAVDRQAKGRLYARRSMRVRSCLILR